MGSFDGVSENAGVPSGNPKEALASQPQRPLDASTIVLPGGICGSRSAGEGEERAHFLVVVEGSESGRRVEFGSRPLTVGRMPPAELVLPDSQVSRNHCRIAVVRGEAFVTDLDSTNGTFIGGTRVVGSVPLPKGALLQVGGQVLEHEWRSRKEVQEAQELDRDLAGASRYVQSLLPPPLREGPIHAEWMLLPSSRLGGDALGYHFLDRHTFAIYLIDVSGHGAGAALHAVSVINVLRQRALPRTDFKKPAQVLKHLNAMFQMDSHGGMYVSMWYGVYDLNARILGFACAGHHPGFLVPPERDRVLPLRTKNVVIGATPDYAFRADSVAVPPGGMLHLFSDGVFEITTLAGAQWGLDDVLPLILEAPVPDIPEPQRLHQAVRARARKGALEDDFSMLVVTFA